MKAALVAVALLVAACGNKSDDVPPEVRATLAKKDAIAARVAELRGLPLKEPVKAAYQTRAEYAAFIERWLEREFPGDEIELLSRIAYRFGFVKARFDLKEAAIEALSGDAMAYYDPENDTFYVLAAVDSEVSAAHELLHGIQDQHFDLQRYYGIVDGKQTLTENDAAARQFVVEGEASLIELAYTHAQSGDDILAAPDRLRTAIEDARLAARMEDYAFAVKDQPLEYFLLSIYAAYSEGVEAVATVYQHGGWPAVAALYERPPESTEQVLHPDKLLGDRDMPVTLALPEAIGDWRRVEDDVLGELAWRSYFQYWRLPDAITAAAGWDGDAVGYYERGDALVMVATTTWDSPEDAAEFATALRAAVAARFPGSEAGTRPDGTRVLIERIGADVIFVDGAPPDAVPAFVDAASSARSSRGAPRDR